VWGGGGANSISLSVSSHCKTGNQFNLVEITFIVFPAKERDSSIACKFTFYFWGFARLLKICMRLLKLQMDVSDYSCGHWYEMMLQIWDVISLTNRSHNFYPRYHFYKWVLWGSHSVWLQASVEFFQLKRHILCTPSCRPLLALRIHNKLTPS